ncbi:MoaD/ThiS family protein [Methylobacillus glycogenes]|uniref:MoaD/ThiS family protein n=1 Tax=Methylobacillus glycogenes TaxID=406 RepID=UPI00047139B6|nr:MoaD/ThiS family protein [Methylobacillus glycogenes]
MITLLYFARLREVLASEGESLPWPQALDVAQLKRLLAARGGVWQQQFAENPRLRAAVNQALVADNAVIEDGDEVAFFPPVTGG